MHSALVSTFGLQDPFRDDDDDEDGLAPSFSFGPARSSAVSVPLPQTPIPVKPLAPKTAATEPSRALVKSLVKPEATEAQAAKLVKIYKDVLDMAPLLYGSAGAFAKTSPTVVGARFFSLVFLRFLMSP